jgi:hypothetical protein
MESSFYQGVKPVILELFGLSKDAIHIHLGFLVFVGAAAVSRRRGWRLLLPVLLFALALEALDLRDDLATLGFPRWGASLHDVINTLWIPGILVVLMRFAAKWRRI